MITPKYHLHLFLTVEAITHQYFLLQHNEQSIMDSQPVISVILVKFDSKEIIIQQFVLAKNGKQLSTKSHAAKSCETLFTLNLNIVSQLYYRSHCNNNGLQIVSYYCHSSDCPSIHISTILKKHHSFPDNLFQTVGC